MAQHAQHLSGLAPPATDPSVPLAAPFRTSLEELRPGCYRLMVRPDGDVATFHGALRVEASGGRMVASGDLYCYPRLAGTRGRAGIRAVEQAPDGSPPAMSALGQPVRPLAVPAHPPRRYHAFLAVTALRAGDTGGGLTITAEEHRCPAPPRASGVAFALVLAPRGGTLERARRPRAPGYTSAYYEGALVVDGVPRGTVALGRVSAHPGAAAHRPAIAA
jgi:hypothetical protein